MVQDLVRLVVGHQGRVVLETEFPDDVHRGDREVPRRRTNPSRPGSGALLEYVGAAQREFSLLGRLEGPDSLVNPAVHRDLVAFGRIAAYLVGVQQRGHRGDEERRRNPSVGQQRQDPPRPHPGAELPLGKLAWPDLAVPERDGLVIRVERQGHRHASPARPLGRQRAARPDVLDVPTPGGLVPPPRRDLSHHSLLACADPGIPTIVPPGATVSGESARGSSS
jgi:hypothetical protein